MIPRICSFSPDRVYRYVLWRQWNDSAMYSRGREYLLVIGLNPSTADETKDDPTIRRCVGFAKRWGFGALCMANLYAFRATKPEVMLQAKDPVGPDNDRWLDICAKDAGQILVAWGKNAAPERASNTVLRISTTKGVYCLGKNKDYTPRHPLYVPADYEPEEYW